MTPSARLAAAIDVLDQIQRLKAPADEVVRAWGRSHRFAGSKDRRAIADHVYGALRAKARSQWRMGADDGRSLVLGTLKDQGEEIDALFTGEAHAPAPVTNQERICLERQATELPAWVRAGTPEWLAGRLEATFGAAWIEEAQMAMIQRAPVDLRVNALRGPVDRAQKLLAHDDVKAETTPFSAWGLRLPPGAATDVYGLKAFTTGWLEVQDEASQIAAGLAGARSGQCVIDYCAGAGGKALALAAAMGGRGRLIASDLDGKRLGAMTERVARAGAKVETRRVGKAGEGLDDLVAAADVVFVDAPCSGSGTWRRHPEAAWRLTPETLSRLTVIQLSVLTQAARLVRPGGRLLYATCSMLGEENQAVAAGFQKGHRRFRPLAIDEAAKTEGLTDAARSRLGALAQGGHTLQLSPLRTQTDGFFVALFERTA